MSKIDLFHPMKEAQTASFNKVAVHLLLQEYIRENLVKTWVLKDNKELFVTLEEQGNREKVIDEFCHDQIEYWKLSHVFGLTLIYDLFIIVVKQEISKRTPKEDTL